MYLLFIESRKMGCSENQHHRWLKMFCVEKIERHKETKDTQKGISKKQRLSFYIIVLYWKKKIEKNIIPYPWKHDSRKEWFLKRVFLEALAP